MGNGPGISGMLVQRITESVILIGLLLFLLLLGKYHWIGLYSRQYLITHKIVVFMKENT